MSHSRSFSHMGIDELLMKKAADTYRRHSLEGGVLDPIKRFGISGVDEALYVLGHRLIPGKTAKAKAYYDDQILQTDRAIVPFDSTDITPEVRKVLLGPYDPSTFNVWRDDRGNYEGKRAAVTAEETKAEQEKTAQENAEREKAAAATRQADTISPEVKSILSTPYNPATFNVLRDERESLRAKRISKMAQQDEPLYSSEHIIHAKDTAKRAFGEATLTALSVFGENAAQYLRRNMFWFLGATMLTMVPYGGVRWAEQQKAYDKVAIEYTSSHEVAPHALPLKRDIPDQLPAVISNLTHTDEVEITWTDDDGNESGFTIPETHSDPQAARRNIATMDGILLRNLTDQDIAGFKTVSAQDKAALGSKRDAAHGTFETIDRSLSFAFDCDRSYPYEEALAFQGNARVQDAVGVMESYMDPAVVERENDSHAKLSFWKWITLGSAALSGLTLFNAARNTGRRHSRRRFYGY